MSATARVADAFAAELVEAGENVAVASLRPGPAPAPPRVYTERRSGVSIHWVAGGGSRSARSSRQDDGVRRLFEEALDAFGPDVVHVLDVEEDFRDAIPAARRRGVRTVADVESLARTPSELDHAIYPSAEIAAHGARSAADGVRAHVIPGCALVDPVVASAGPRVNPEERGSLLLAAICELEASAGLEAVLDSLRLAGLGPVELTVLGRVVDHRIAPTLRAAAEAVPGLVLRLFGMFEPRELPGLLADVDCVLIPLEPSKATAVDTRHALACGAPVVSARADGSPDPGMSPSAVLSFDRRSPAELGEVLRRIGGDPAFLSRLRGVARRTPVLGPKEYARAVREVYVDVLAADR